MDTAFSWLDAILIAPFRLISHAHISMWLGCFCLALYCLIIGNLLHKFFLRLHAKYYSNLQGEMQDYHALSMKALHSGNKEAYLASNKLAHEYFGKHFFARASVGMAALVPIPFALAWLSLRFEGIVLYKIPFTSITMGYVFVFLTAYICVRISWGRSMRFYRKILLLILMCIFLVACEGLKNLHLAFEEEDDDDAFFHVEQVDYSLYENDNKDNRDFVTKQHDKVLEERAARNKKITPSNYLEQKLY